jgi:hypothetical protein
VICSGAGGVVVDPTFTSGGNAVVVTGQYSRLQQLRQLSSGGRKSKNRKQDTTPLTAA